MVHVHIFFFFFIGTIILTGAVEIFIACTFDQKCNVIAIFKVVIFLHAKLHFFLLLIFFILSCAIGFVDILCEIRGFFFFVVSMILKCPFSSMQSLSSQ